MKAPSTAQHKSTGGSCVQKAKHCNLFSSLPVEVLNVGLTSDVGSLDFKNQWTVISGGSIVTCDVV